MARNNPADVSTNVIGSVVIAPATLNETNSLVNVDQLLDRTQYPELAAVLELFPTTFTLDNVISNVDVHVSHSKALVGSEAEICFDENSNMILVRRLLYNGSGNLDVSSYSMDGGISWSHDANTSAYSFGAGVNTAKLQNCVYGNYYNYNNLWYRFFSRTSEQYIDPANVSVATVNLARSPVVTSASTEEICAGVVNGKIVRVYGDSTANTVSITEAVNPSSAETLKAVINRGSGAYAQVNGTASMAYAGIYYWLYIQDMDCTTSYKFSLYRSLDLVSWDRLFEGVQETGSEYASMVVDSADNIYFSDNSPTPKVYMIKASDQNTVVEVGAVPVENSYSKLVLLGDIVWFTDRYRRKLLGYVNADLVSQDTNNPLIEADQDARADEKFSYGIAKDGQNAAWVLSYVDYDDHTTVMLSHFTADLNPNEFIHVPKVIAAGADQKYMMVAE